ncbi:nitroreductase family deazaflavin-dependent oxidoreductase [Nocardia rhizosphaerihabitans]|uniref:Nitroreductase n=1 Tax=Nocardia rhizosphaerihabitans TaxID=1691570 RepID=A0ABQ2KTU5_9NOCA|nr:nitroreductase family deazaflavin-dependent oxidoreductase [Nocardia rhizosphaerihabitans]GGN92318.1 nitroreductase [Nocardia rhizosphaerihabitans]
MSHRPRPRQLDSPLLPKLFKLVGRAQVAVYRRTGGRIGGTWRIGAGFRKPVPTLLLEHRGRTTNRQYTVPLLYLVHGEDVIVVASQGGLPKHPQWYRNLCVHPDTHIQIGSERRAVRAVVADATRRAELWPLLVDLYADFATYQSWTEREIPVVILEPRAES